MRSAFFILVLMLFGAAYAADMEAVGTAEAERKAATEAERAAKEAAEAQSSASSSAAMTTTATAAAVSAASPETLAACGKAEIADAVAARAIAEKAKSDAEIYAASPGLLTLAGPDSAAALAASHATLDASAVKAAYFSGVCVGLSETGVSRDALRPVLAELAQKLGVSYPALAATGTKAAETGTAAPAGPDPAALAAQDAAEREARERAAKETAEREAAERAAKEAADREAAERAAKEAADREAAERVAKETADREAAERAAKEVADREAAERAAKEAADREAAERAAKEVADREAAERVAKEAADREAAERAAKEAADREAAERAAKETADREAAERAAKETAERVAKEAGEQKSAEQSAPPAPVAATEPPAAAPAEPASPPSPVAAAPAPEVAPIAAAPPPAAAPVPLAAAPAPETPAPADGAPSIAGGTPPASPPAATPGSDGMLGEAECRALGVLGKCPDLNAVLAKLLEKPLEYNHPKQMLLGKVTEISLVLRTDWEGKDLPREVSEELKGLPGEVRQGLTKVTRVMSAELSGRDFEVSPTGRQERTVSPPEQVSWSWQVRPTETGTARPLKLRLYAHLQGPDGTMPPLLVKTLDATINVDVTTWDWIVNQARTLEPVYAVGAALIGLMTALMTFFISRRRREMHEGAGAHGGESEPTTRAGPVIGDLNQSAADSRVPSAAPAPAPATVAAEDKKDKPSGTIPVDPDGGIEPKKD